jgi:DNA modification methylase
MMAKKVAEGAQVYVPHTGRPKIRNLFCIPRDIADAFIPQARAVVAAGDCMDSLNHVPDGTFKLIITSPPYNIGKCYEKTVELEHYLDALRPIIHELVRVLHPEGSICWQVGNYVENSEIFPLDMFYYRIFKQSEGLKLRNRIVWFFEHGLHASKRFSGRYETLLWFTKGETYTFNLDPVRVPSKYPGKRHFKGDKRGLPSCNPLGKNPSDIWKIVVRDWETALWNIPNVKANHPEKTIHPCQFPIELVERCVLALTNEDDWLLDPFSGVGSAMLAALKNDRRAMGCEREVAYVAIAKERIKDLYAGMLRYRQLGKPVYQPTGREKVSQIPLEWIAQRKVPS